MFDFGFSKLLILGIVALVVIGPERLPKVARTLGHLYGRLQRYVTQVKSDISREMEAAELGKVKSEFESAARSFQTEVESGVREVDQQMREAQTSIERTLDAAAAPEAPGAPQATPAPSVASAPASADLPAPSPQLELGIEEPAQPAARERAVG
jgi:sec-independent protein translocase protein TatB